MRRHWLCALRPGVNGNLAGTRIACQNIVLFLTTVAFDPTHDRGLRARDASHLFAPSTTYITLRANTYLRRFAYDFIKSVAPSLEPEVVKAALKSPKSKS